MKIIDIEELKDVLIKLIEKRISRDEASNWAFKIREAHDRNSLDFSPKSLEDIIWDELSFIESNDLKVSPMSYLYDEMDIQACLERLKNATEELNKQT